MCVLIANIAGFTTPTLPKMYVVVAKVAHWVLVAKVAGFTTPTLPKIYVMVVNPPPP